MEIRLRSDSSSAKLVEEDSPTPPPDDGSRERAVALGSSQPPRLPTAPSGQAPGQRPVGADPQPGPSRLQGSSSSSPASGAAGGSGQAAAAPLDQKRAGPVRARDLRPGQERRFGYVVADDVTRQLARNGVRYRVECDGQEPVDCSKRTELVGAVKSAIEEHRVPRVRLISHDKEALDNIDTATLRRWEKEGVDLVGQIDPPGVTTAAWAGFSERVMQAKLAGSKQVIDALQDPLSLFRGYAASQPDCQALVDIYDQCELFNFPNERAKVLEYLKGLLPEGKLTVPEEWLGQLAQIAPVDDPGVDAVAVVRGIHGEVARLLETHVNAWGGASSASVASSLPAASALPAAAPSKGRSRLSQWFSRGWSAKSSDSKGGPAERPAGARSAGKSGEVPAGRAGDSAAARASGPASPERDGGGGGGGGGPRGAAPRPGALPGRGGFSVGDRVSCEDRDGQLVQGRIQSFRPRSKKYMVSLDQGGYLLRKSNQLDRV
jgi:hypothetical protein